jgi:DNA-binding NarL/FixJ family response regulator
MAPHRPLSDHQRRVLRFAADGLTGPEIAARLGVDTGNVHVELCDAMEALDAGSKLEAIILACRRGEV